MTSHKSNTQTVKKYTYAPPDLLAVNQKDPKYTYHWIKPNDRMNFIDGKEVRGWEIVRWGAIDTESNEPLMGILSQFGVKTLGSIIRTGDLILARMPNEMANARNEFYLNKNQVAKESIKRVNRKLEQQPRSDVVTVDSRSEAQEWRQASL